MDRADVARQFHGFHPEAVRRSRSRCEQAHGRYHIRHRRDRSTRSASRSAASSAPAAFAAAAMRGRRAGSAGSAAISAASRSGVKSACWRTGSRRRPSPARWRWRAGPGRAHAAAAPGSPGRPIAASSATVEAPERDTTRCAGRHARRQIGEERRDLGRDAEPRVGLAHPRHVLVARLLHDRQGAPASAASSSLDAGGTISAMTRAPWLPPNTSSERSGPHASGGIGRGGAAITAGRTGLPVSVALACNAGRPACTPAKAVARSRRRAAPAACWRGPSRAFCS